ncbi:hypothetical protein L249_1404 [Ophiocordyceps polyrhachis-furcata BCC 54312]|uniref:Uncharacterized protein n=1 Tax=Ophiocordyceps polyrhachis-furcata BCC 54312 TaxID=1330021 RepID=A0A367L484_9HYPO|nr:hypothetical protein L249_1404 [Ophiocordyceps polyrhachis-furcata BCC 54312]
MVSRLATREFPHLDGWHFPTSRHSRSSSLFIYSIFGLSSPDGEAFQDNAVLTPLNAVASRRSMLSTRPLNSGGWYIDTSLSKTSSSDNQPLVATRESESETNGSSLPTRQKANPSIPRNWRGGNPGLMSSSQSHRFQFPLLGTTLGTVMVLPLVECCRWQETALLCGFSCDLLYPLYFDPAIQVGAFFSTLGSHLIK